MRNKNKSDLLQNIFILLYITSLLFVVTCLYYFPTYHIKSPAKVIKNTAEAVYEEELSTKNDYIDIKRLKENFVNNFLINDGDEIMNIVFLGFDRSGPIEHQQSLNRPDSIIVFSLNVSDADISLLSIPRDSYVKIHGTEIYDKINHSYMYGYKDSKNEEGPHRGGIKSTLMTISEFLNGVPVNYYIAVDMDGAADIIDNIGGMYYEVDIEVHSQFGDGSILVEKGYQLLDGKKFMNYVRNRADHQGGELGRIERQQKILIALFDQLRREERLINITKLYKTVDPFIETNLSFAQITSLVIFAQRVMPDSVNRYIFSGEGQLLNNNGKNAWFLLLNEEKKNSIIRDVFGLVIEEESQINYPAHYISDPLEDSKQTFEDDIEREKDLQAVQ